MVKITFTDEQYAKIVAGLNTIIDINEEATQGVFNIHRINKGNVKEVVAYEAMANSAVEAQKVWSILDKAKTHSETKITIE